MKQLLPPANATFSASGNTITFATTIPSTISHILHVTNVTRGVIYFQPQAGTAYSGTYVSPVLTIAASTNGHADADKLEIFYDDAVTTLGVTGTFYQATQPISAASLPLPSGAATETTLGGVLTTSDFDTKTGSLTETAPATDTASSGLNGRLQRIAQRLTSLISALGSPFQAGGSIGNTTFASTIADGADVTLGAKADAKSTATDTTAITAMSVLKQISASVQAPPSQAVTNTGTFAAQAAITAASGSIASGAIASGAVASGALASGSVASGALASGSIVDGASVTLGAKADAKSTATDTTSITVMQVLKQISASVQAPPSQAVTGTVTANPTRPATPTQSSVANNASSVTVLASNANRLGATIFNDDTAGTGATLKLKLGATASATSFTIAMAPQSYYEVPFGYTGIIDGIASAGSGNARITELTA